MWTFNTYIDTPFSVCIVRSVFRAYITLSLCYSKYCVISMLMVCLLQEPVMLTGFTFGLFFPQRFAHIMLNSIELYKPLFFLFVFWTCNAKIPVRYFDQNKYFPLPNWHIMSANICNISVTALQLSAVGFPLSVKYL